jgi:ABC-2 type transport system ATP-binding protein
VSILVKNITKLFGEQKALSDVSFSVGSGEIVGFLGPNGAGKSTMMKIITCFLPPTSGEVKVCGYDVLEQSIDVRSRVGYLPEHNPLYLDMYIKEYLQYVCGIYKITDTQKQIKNLIDQTGLGIEQHKKIGALSKGYRQRVDNS